MFGLDKPYVEEKEAFGSHWCGPHKYEHATEVLVARYESESHCDGQTVEVFCTPMPARFYTVKAQNDVSSVGRPYALWECGTGSGQAELAANIAEAVSTGMLGFDCSCSYTHQQEVIKGLVGACNKVRSAIKGFGSLDSEKELLDAALADAKENPSSTD